MFKVTHYWMSGTVLITLRLPPWESLQLREQAAAITTSLDIDTQTQVASCLPKLTRAGVHPVKYYSYFLTCPPTPHTPWTLIQCQEF